VERVEGREDRDRYAVRDTQRMELAQQRQDPRIAEAAASSDLNEIDTQSEILSAWSLLNRGKTPAS